MPCSEASASDEELSCAWQAGDPTAGSALISRHHTAIRRFLERRLDVDADDALQEVWTIVSSTIHCYQHRSSFRTWLFAIATNQLRVAYRSHNRTQKIQALAQDLLDPPGHDPATVCSQRQTLFQLAASLTDLPPPLQRILALYYFERHPAASIGRWLAIPENTVRSRVRRALELLLEGLNGPSCDRTAPSEGDPIRAWLRSVDLEFATLPLGHAA